MKWTRNCNSQCHMFGRSISSTLKSSFIVYCLLNLYFAQWNILIIATNVLISIRYSDTVVILIETGDQATSKIQNTFVLWQPHEHISETEIIDIKKQYLAPFFFLSSASFEKSTLIYLDDFGKIYAFRYKNTPFSCLLSLFEKIK